MTKINDNQLTIQHLSNNEIMMNWNQKCLIYIEREIPHHCCCSQKIFFFVAVAIWEVLLSFIEIDPLVHVLIYIMGLAVSLLLS